MGQGECCCPTGDRISTKAECTNAHDALGLRSDLAWEGSTDSIPGGCSTRQFRSHNLHWNSMEPGRARSDMTPICKQVRLTTTATTTTTTTLTVTSTSTTFDPTSPLVTYWDQGGCGPR